MNDMVIFMNVSVRWYYPHNDANCWINSINANLSINVQTQTRMYKVISLSLFCNHYFVSYRNTNDLNEIVDFIETNNENSFLIENGEHGFLTNNIELIVHCVEKTNAQNIGV